MRRHGGCQPQVQESGKHGSSYREVAEFRDVVPNEGRRKGGIQGRLAGALGVPTTRAGDQHAWGFTRGFWGALGTMKCTKLKRTWRSF